MKTAVSIPDAVFDAAERLAERLGLSRSELYARAIDAYTRRQSAGSPNWGEYEDSEITELINASLRQAGQQNGELDAAWKASRNRALGKEDW